MTFYFLIMEVSIQCHLHIILYNDKAVSLLKLLTAINTIHKHEYKHIQHKQSYGLCLNKDSGPC